MKKASPGKKRRRSSKRHTTVRRRKRKGGLSAGTKPALFNTGKGALGGLIYGFAMTALDGMITDPKNKPIAKTLGGLLLSVLATTIAKQPAIGAGIAGATGQALGMQYGILKDDDTTIEFVQPDTLLNDDGMVSDDYGNWFAPLQDGTYIQVPPPPMQRTLTNRAQFGALSDGGNFQTIYPSYSNPGFY